MLQGHWWIPGREDHSVPGILSLTSSEIRLQVTGALEEDEAHFGLSHLDEIQGITSGGTDLTKVEGAASGKLVFLKNCLQTGSGTTFSSSALRKRLPTSSYSAIAAFTVDNTTSLKDTSLTFHEIKIGFTHLPDFALTNGRLVHNDVIANGDGGTDGVNASFRFRALPGATINGVTVEFHQTVNTNGDSIRRYAIEPGVHLKLRSPTPLSMQQWQTQFITPLQHLLTLATSRLNLVNDILGFHDANTESLQFPEEELAVTQQIHFNVYNKEVLETAKTDVSEALFLLFRLGDVKDRFEDLLRRWLSLYEKHRPVQNLFFGVLYSEGGYIEDRFLNLARALEVYHRSNFPGGIRPKAEFKALRKEIIEQVDEEHREWLKGKLAGANELTLQDRLVYLLNDKCNFLVQELDVLSEDLGAQIKRQRNRLTHYGDEKRKADPSALAWLSYFMEYMLQTLLLTEVGFPPETIRKDRQYQFRMGKIKQALSHLIPTGGQEASNS